MTNFEKILIELEKNNLLRKRREIDFRSGKILKISGKEFVDFCSNDYLGFADDKITKSAANAAIEKWGTGAAASRLISGDLSLIRTLEEKIAEFKQTESSLVFPTGFMANLGAITALVSNDDTVILDRLAHASLVDGARLSGARLKVFPHNDIEKLDTILSKISSGKKLVLTESVFSMDGDKAPLKKLVDCCKKNDAMLLVDEAHALGVYGNGRGCVAEENLANEVDVVVGTLSKAIGCQGGFVAGKKSLIEFLVNRARSFIYTTGINPASAGAALVVLEELSSNNSRVEKLWDNVNYLREKIKNLPLIGEGPICPVMAGKSDSALALSKRLFENGFLVPAIRPPTVPKGTARIRITISSAHTKEQLKCLAKVLTQINREKS